MNDVLAFFAGLDLGQQADFSALVVVERRSVPSPDKPGKTQYAFDVRHLHRWPLKTPYPEIIADTKALFPAIAERRVGDNRVKIRLLCGFGNRLLPRPMLQGH